MLPDELYDQVWRRMPIPCIDLLVTSQDHQVLLVLRGNEPARGEWWFPGGRIHYGETRAEAASRKLREECGLMAEEVTELATYDLTLPMGSMAPERHCITTLYRVCTYGVPLARLDGQATASVWKTRSEWEQTGLHPFVADCLARHLSIPGDHGRKLLPPSPSGS